MDLKEKLLQKVVEKTQEKIIDKLADQISSYVVSDVSEVTQQFFDTTRGKLTKDFKKAF